MAGSSINPDILKRYLEGKCSREEAALVEQWYGQTEHDDIPPELDIPQHLSRVKKGISETESPREATLPARKTGKITYRIYMAAASVALLAVLSVALILSGRGHLPAADEFTEVSNTESRIIRYQLPDKSLVWLHPNARLRYAPSAFSSAGRKVSLLGEAFFDIAKNPASPFVVEAGDMRVKVLGTSFLVSPGNNQAGYEVAVVSGKVEVYSEDKNSSAVSRSVVLNPSEKASFHTLTGAVTTSKIPASDPRIETWQPASLLFDDTSLKEVARQLELKFGLEVRFEDSSLGNCMLKASFENHRLVEVLDAMSEMLELTYELTQKQVILRGSGCPENS